ncbi:hypothetical protein LCGC14_3026880 [marine sediment metagenome]|uniref:Uncharacterized protein n=1 Tax=marine sediment metagenome TaxID=412755 RepID=A0A0F8WTF7_9ZZZZ
MKEYTVRVTETTAWNIKVQAENPDQAIEQVEELRDSSLDWNKEHLDDVNMDIGSCEIEVVEEV